MLNTIIRFSLRNPLLVLVVSLLLIGYGVYQTAHLPIDVLPDLNRPRVVVIAECPGMAPEEVETLVTFPIETYLNGATGITSIRSSSTAGLALLTVEFDWNMDGFLCRQIVDERLQLSAEQLPPGVVARMTPMASMMGQIMYLTVWDENPDESKRLSPMELRTLSDWVIRKQLLGSGGISEVLVIGGDVKQYQVQVRADDLRRYDISIREIEEAIAKSNRNVTGGFLTGQGPEQLLVRSLGRINDPLPELGQIVVKGTVEPPILLHQVADVKIAPAVKVGDSSTYIKNADGTTRGGPAIVLTIEKQVGEDTRRLSENILAQVDNLLKSLKDDYPGLRIEPLYQQQTFINLAIQNVEEALWVGAFLVLIVLVLFLMNVRTTLITITAMPVSIIVTCVIFAWFGLSINTMTLGGLAVAIGELVDDAIVDVENIFRRLRENYALEHPQSVMHVVFKASSEIRNSIFFGTLVTVLVFFPVFFLPGMEGKLFAPLGISYVVSLLASLVVSLTITPILSMFLLPKIAEAHREKEGWILRGVKELATLAIRVSLQFPKTILAGSVVLVLVAAAVFLTLERDFMPPFNEGAPQVNVSLPPGRSLKTASEYADSVARELLKIEGVQSVVRKTGRAELDEHAVPVNMSEMLCTLDLKSHRSVEDIFNDIEKVIDPIESVPGVIAFYDQPLQHLIAHLRSGTRAQIAIKIRGDDPLLLRKRAIELQQLVQDIPGVGTPRIDPVQTDIPQLRIVLDRNEIAKYGLTEEDVNGMIETAMYGSVPTQILEGKRSFDVLVRLSDQYREDIDSLGRLPIRLPSGGVIPLSAVASIDSRAHGPSKIDHEAGRPQITLQMNPRGRGAVDVKNDLDRRIEPRYAELTAGDVHLEMTGLFQSEQESTRRLVLLSFISLVGIFLVLYRMFGSVNIVLQIMTALPLALVGAVAAIVITGQDRSIPNLVGMISLCGISTRNGILLIDHYFHLMKYEGETFSKEMLIKAGRNRVAPVLMTALTSSIGLIPLTLSPDTPGREILYPIATVVVGGLFTSTLMEFFVRPALFWTFGKGK